MNSFVFLDSFSCLRNVLAFCYIKTLLPKEGKKPMKQKKNNKKNNNKLPRILSVLNHNLNHKNCFDFQFIFSLFGFFVIFSFQSSSCVLFFS